MGKKSKAVGWAMACVMAVPGVTGIVYAVQNPNTTLNWFKGENSDQKLKTIQDDFELSKNEIESAKKQIEALKNGQASDATTIATLQGNLKTTQQRLNNALEEIKNIRAESSVTIATLQTEINQKKADLETATRELEILRTQHAEDTEAINQKTNEIAQIQSSLSAKEQELSEAQQSLLIKLQEIQTLQSQLQETQNQLNEALEELENLKGEEEPPVQYATFAEASWEEISQVCESGQASEVYNVGDEKTIQLSTGEVITVAVMGFNHDDLSDGTGKASMTLGMLDCLETQYKINSFNSNAGGWDASLMRTETMATLLSQLPADLQEIVKAVNKKTSAGLKSTNIITSSDKLWLFSKVEIDNTTDATYSDEGKQYDYWKTKTAPTDRIKKCNDSACFWWLRSPDVTRGVFFHYVMHDGYLQSNSVNDAHGVSFGFCI